MSKAKRDSQIRMIPIDRVNILNPRVRSQKVFHEIASNITQVGLKRPITVTPNSTAPGKDYDLVCGQGRLEAFLAAKQTEIPALIIEADQEQVLIMSLVENCARRQHRALDLMQGVGLLQKQGYGAKEIAAKTGLSEVYVSGVLNLLERGEERLLSAVEAGHIPISLAIKVAEAPGEEQKALQEAYESKQLRGTRLMAAKRLIDQRQRRGKTLHSGSRNSPGGRREISAKDVLKVYQREVDRKRMLTRKAETVSNKLLFITEALRQLMREEHFVTLLRAEKLTTLPKPIAALMAQKGGIHA